MVDNEPDIEDDEICIKSLSLCSDEIRNLASLLIPDLDKHFLDDVKEEALACINRDMQQSKIPISSFELKIAKYVDPLVFLFPSRYSMYRCLDVGKSLILALCEMVCEGGISAKSALLILEKFDYVMCTQLPIIRRMHGIKPNRKLVVKGKLKLYKIYDERYNLLIEDANLEEISHEKIGRKLLYKCDRLRFLLTGEEDIVSLRNMKY